MKVIFATDHAGFDTKNELVAHFREVGYEVQDCGAFEFDKGDDYPKIIAVAAEQLLRDEAAGKDSRLIVAGGSGQGEMMAANKFSGVRCALYYGDPGIKQVDASGDELDILTSTRLHNNANALSLALRFLTFEQARDAIALWLETSFPNETRHARRIEQLNTLGRDFSM